MLVVLYHCLSNNFVTIITFFVTIITKIECHFCQTCQIVCQILTKMAHGFLCRKYLIYNILQI